MIARGIFKSTTGRTKKMMTYICEPIKTARSIEWKYADPSRTQLESRDVVYEEVPSSVNKSSS